MNKLPCIMYIYNLLNDNHVNELFSILTHIYIYYNDVCINKNIY